MRAKLGELNIGDEVIIRIKDFIKEDCKGDVGKVPWSACDEMLAADGEVTQITHISKALRLHGLETRKIFIENDGYSWCEQEFELASKQTPEKTFWRKVASTFFSS
jgi:hypothetical protein